MIYSSYTFSGLLCTLSKPLPYSAVSGFFTSLLFAEAPVLELCLVTEMGNHRF
jgi:hypothetical protein